jgi:hypothetical protein
MRAGRRYAARAVPGRVRRKHVTSSMGAARQPQSLEFASGDEPGLVRQSAEYWRSALVFLARYPGHATSERAHRLGFHALGLAQAGTGLVRTRGLPARDSTRIRPARPGDGRDARRRQARDPSERRTDSGRGGCGPVDHSLQYRPPRISAGAARDRARQPDQDQRQHGSVACLLRYA